MPGFGEGLVQGLSAVGGLLADQERGELERKRLAMTQDQFDKNYGLQKAGNEAQQKHMQTMEGLQGRELTERTASNIRNEELARDKLAADTEHNKAAEKNDALRTQYAGLSAQTQAEANKAHADYYRTTGEKQNALTDIAINKENRAQRLADAQESTQALLGYAIRDQAGNVTDFKVPEGHEQIVADHLQRAGLAIPDQDMAQNARDMALIHSALEHKDHRSYFASQHGQNLLDAANRQLKGVINLRAGEVSDAPETKGLIIGESKMTDLVPAYDKNGKVIDGVHYPVLTEYMVNKDGTPAIGKDGKQITSTGPITNGRDDSPDAMVQPITDKDLFMAMQRQHTINSWLASNPDAHQHLVEVMKTADMMRSGKHPNTRGSGLSGGKWEIKTIDDGEGQRSVLFNPETQEIKPVPSMNGEGESSDQQQIDAFRGTANQLNQSNKNYGIGRQVPKPDAYYGE